MLSKPELPPRDSNASGSPPTRSPLDKALARLGLLRDIDLALHLPLRYEDETRVVQLASLHDGESAQIEATVTACEVVYRPRRQLLVTLDDGSDTCLLRFFNFYPSQQKALGVGARVRARGEFRGGLSGWTALHPVVRSANTALPTTLTPVYPTVAGLAQPTLRRAVLRGLALADLDDTLAPGVWPRQGNGSAAWTLRQALTLLHQPPADCSVADLEDRQHPAWQRLKAEELLAQQLSQSRARQQRQELRAPVLSGAGAAEAHGPGLSPGVHVGLQRTLPFALTKAQQRVCAEIEADMGRAIPMHRLLQGDVGSGKTVVAALAAARCIDSGWQCALMAPTEILAEQHFRKLVGWIEPLLAPRGLRIAWLTGSLRARDKREATEAVARGEAALVVGTHAVIQDKVVFARLGLAVIDEQHRFGVAQRLALRQKMAAVGQEPHLLMMTATPIPRTLAMTAYADLDVSTIDELPPGRTPVLTKLVANERREEVVARIRAQIEAGRQVYWVCPLIEESESLDLRNATDTHAALVEELAGVMAPGGAPAQVGLLHARLPVAEKKAVMQAFVQGAIHLLVSTTVIEVGVDVPNASLMVIEHAERFGLSQLHQLRGRVGRGAAASACVLLYGATDGARLSPHAKERLRAMAQTHDGFEIAQRDLDIRGPGEFLGARQSGAALLRFADLSTDSALLEWARHLAPQLLAQDPAAAERHVERWLGGKSDFLKA